MTAQQVGQAFQAALAQAYASGNSLPFTLRGDTLDLTGFTSTEVAGGPFGITTSLPGDQFGAFNTSTGVFGNTNATQPGLLRALNNGF